MFIFQLFVFAFCDACGFCKSRFFKQKRQTTKASKQTTKQTSTKYKITTNQQQRQHSQTKQKYTTTNQNNTSKHTEQTTAITTRNRTKARILTKKKRTAHTSKHANGIAQRKQNTDKGYLTTQYKTTTSKTRHTQQKNINGKHTFKHRGNNKNKHTSTTLLHKERHKTTNKGKHTQTNTQTVTHKGNNTYTTKGILTTQINKNRQ